MSEKSVPEEFWAECWMLLSAKLLSYGYVDLPHEIVDGSLKVFAKSAAKEEGFDYVLGTVNNVTRVVMISRWLDAASIGDRVVFTYRYS